MQIISTIACSLIFLLSISAYAQDAVQQSGTVTKGHAAMWTAKSTIQDAGPWSGGGPEVGITNLPIVGPKTPLCIYDAPVTNSLGYHSLCLGANDGDKGKIAYSSGGAATPLPLQICANGQCFDFPFIGPGNGNVIGPATSTMSNVACWNNTTGTLLKECAELSIINANYPTIFSPSAPTSTLKVQVGGDPGINHTYIKNIANGVFSNLLVPPTTTDSVAAAFSGWTSGSSTGVNNANLVLFGGSFSKADGNNPYGSTLTICNCAGFQSSAASGKNFTYMVGYEVDVQVLSKGGLPPTGDMYGFLAVSESEALPIGYANGFTSRHQGSGAYGYKYSFYSDNGAARDGGLFMGMQAKSGLSNSQSIIFQSSDGVTGLLGGLTYNAGGNFVFSPGTPGGTLGTSGHYASSAAAVTLASCGTSPVVGTSNDTRGIVQVGSGTVTSCSVNFTNQYAQVPSCVVTSADPAIPAGIAVLSGFGMQIQFPSNAAGIKFTYFCMQ